MKSSKVKLIILLVSFLIIFYFIGPGIPCLFHEITNLYCPGCGITRMFLSLFKLDFYQAFRYNPLVFILLILGIIYWLIKIICQKFKNINLIIPNKIWYVLLIIVIIFGIMRNIPFFDYLGPTNI